MKISSLPKPVLLLIVVGLIIVSAVSFESVHAKAKNFLMPGPVSATHPNNEVMNGYASHAEFEQECGHCHAPIHCVTDTRCQDCHMEIAQQRVEGRGLHGKLPGTSKCQTCHVEHRGREVVISEMAYSGVDHFGLAGFSLASHQVDYENVPMDCDGCHSKDRFIEDTLDCITCHVNADHDYMAEHMELYGSDCMACHDGVDRMRDFDHDEYYVLDGQHAQAECISCHEDLVYAGKSQDCASCHQDPEYEGMFGQDCARCHSTTAWLPAQLTQHTFVLTHGGLPVDGCQSCHTAEFTTIDCVGCHDHTDEMMKEFHVNCGLEDYFTQTCIDCHPTGEKGDTDQQACVSDESAAVP